MDDILDYDKPDGPQVNRALGILIRLDKFFIAFFIISILFKLMSWPFLGILMIVLMFAVAATYIFGWPIFMGKRPGKFNNIYPRLVSITFGLTALVYLFATLNWPGANEIATVVFPAAVLLLIVGVIGYILGDRYLEQKVVVWSVIRLAIVLWVVF